ncbi:MAG: cobalamin-dependent protein [Candidatus Omnitrophota bacterium]
MKVFLVNLPWKRGGLWGVRAGSRWPHIKTARERHYLPFPFFMAYAAALLKREGFEVRLIDALAEEMPMPRLLSLIRDEKPDLLLAETSTPSLPHDLSMIQKLPPGIPVALCGPEIHIRDVQFLGRHPRITYVMVGEYEITLLELVQHLVAGKDLSGVKGLIYRQEGECKVNPARPLLENLDELPWPLRDGHVMEKYNDAPGGIPFPSVQMWSSRGCPYQCLFCSWPQLMYQSHRYRIRSVVDVVNEMEYLVNEKGFKSVYFDDDTMNIGKHRMMELADEIKRRAVNVPWAMMARADLMEEDLLENLFFSGPCGGQVWGRIRRPETGGSHTEEARSQEARADGPFHEVPRDQNPFNVHIRFAGRNARDDP